MEILPLGLEEVVSAACAVLGSDACRQEVGLVFATWALLVAGLLLAEGGLMVGRVTFATGAPLTKRSTAENQNKERKIRLEQRVKCMSLLR